MADIYNNSSDSSYSYTSIRYFCNNCQRQFSQLCLNSNSPSPAQCPRCNLYADPQPINTSNATASAGSSSSQPQPQRAPFNEEQQQQQQQQQYMYYTQQMMDPFGRIYLRTFRIPVNTQPQPQPQQRESSGANIFDQLFGSFFGINPLFGGNMFGGVDERLIEEFLRNDPNNYGPAPAPEEAINKLQEVKFEHAHSHGEGSGAESACCSICQEDYQQGDNLVRLPCKHEYHKDCVSTWLSQHNSCPMCRQAI